MVKESEYRELRGEPPPLDKSWWRAILAEEEQFLPPIINGKQRAEDNNVETVQHVEVESPQTDWDKAYALFELDETIHLQVTGYNRGGLLVNGDGLQGFVPVSHLVNNKDEHDGLERVLQDYLEQSIRLKIIECDQTRGRVVLSERAAQSESGKRNMLFRDLKSGSCISGRVTNITDFGIFVDLGGVEGLVHVSEISWGRVRHPADIVSLGEEIEVFIIQVDRERARVALSLKRLHHNPWETAQIRYQPGQITEAVVTSIVPFGAFARLEEGLDGLIHISEIDQGGALNHPGEVLQEGQQISVRVLHVDSTRQRLGLSLCLDNDTGS